MGGPDHDRFQDLSQPCVLYGQYSNEKRQARVFDAFDRKTFTDLMMMTARTVGRAVERTSQVLRVRAGGSEDKIHELLLWGMPFK